MSSINAKLGLKAKTKARAATHSAQVAGAVRCPKCESRHVMKSISRNGMRSGAFWCGSCSAFFNV